MLLASSQASLSAISTLTSSSTTTEERSTNRNRDVLANLERSRFDRLIDALAPADALEREIAGRIVHNHIKLDELTQSTSARLVAGDLARDSKELAALVKLEAHFERMLAASLRDLRTLRSLRGRAPRQNVWLAPNPNLSPSARTPFSIASTFPPPIRIV